MDGWDWIKLDEIASRGKIFIIFVRFNEVVKKSRFAGFIVILS